MSRNNVDSDFKMQNILTILTNLTPYTKGFMTHNWNNYNIILIMILIMNFDTAIVSQFCLWKFWHYLVVIFHIEATQFLLDLEYECCGLTSKYVQFKYFIFWLAQIIYETSVQLFISHLYFGPTVIGNIYSIGNFCSCGIDLITNQSLIYS